MALYFPSVCSNNEQPHKQQRVVFPNNSYQAKSFKSMLPTRVTNYTQTEMAALNYEQAKIFPAKKMN
jgi:hypothetical protein